MDEIELPKQRFRKGGFNVLALVLFFGLGLFVGRYMLAPGEAAVPASLQFVSVEDGERQLVFDTFWEAWDTLNAKFIGELDEEKLFYGAVRGLVSAADDPYTVFSDPPTTKQFEETIEGSFSGVGIEIGVRNRVPTIIAPLPGSPADQAGLQAGDVIVKVDDTEITQEMTLDDLVRLIRGPKGSEVRLTVVHEDANEISEYTVVRDTIEIESVKLEIENGIAHLTITNFNGDTAERFNAAARDILDANVRGIVLDVRNNPGGFLQASVDIASRFIPRGELVVTERGEQEQQYVAKGNTNLADIPTVVLVNGGSASASEILAGALRDQLGTKVVGTQTYGKGSVQEFITFDDGSSLRVTIAKWFTPNGTSINEEGVTPDVEVKNERETEDVDEQLDKAREELEKIFNGESDGE